jgi:hypothetical protein
LVLEYVIVEFGRWEPEEALDRYFTPDVLGWVGPNLSQDVFEVELHLLSLQLDKRHI